MIAWIASVQPLVIAALLSWAGAVKLRGLRTPEEISRSAISRIVGDERASLTWRLVGGLELVIAAALLLPPAHPVKPGAAAALTAGFLGFLWYVRLTAPESSCGCLSSRPARVSWRSFGRAGLL
ncbi:MAG: MauE/DoxX family redox-associated membrane protein, partial [Micromonosporaceae bacterium]